MYKSNVWTFPAGKINQNEIGIDAAAREVYEETGFDPHCTLGGLTKEWLDNEETEKIQWNRPLRDPEDALTFVEQQSGKLRTCCKWEYIMSWLEWDKINNAAVDAFSYTIVVCVHLPL